MVGRPKSDVRMIRPRAAAAEMSGPGIRPSVSETAICPDKNQAYSLSDPQFCPDPNQAYRPIVRGPDTPLAWKRATMIPSVASISASRVPASKKRAEAMFITLMHGDVLILSGDDFEVSVLTSESHPLY